MKRGWPERWADGGWLIAALTPLSWAYALLWRLAWAWRSRVPAEAVPGLKVISIGNLSVGGTGKSALVRAVALAALKKRRKTAVLLRGYGALEGSRPLWVSLGKGALVGARLCGDEAREHARVPGLGVLVDADRLRGAREARGQGYELLVLDDGFQRRWQLQRDADLLLASWPEIERGERLLPAGPWREPWSRAAGVTALLLQDATPQTELPWPWSALPRVDVGYQPMKLWAWVGGVLKAGPPLSRLKGRQVLALSGLGQPARFEASLRGLGASPQSARFADHHAFSVEELQALSTGACTEICTTMKDAMRLPFQWRPSVPVWVLEAELQSRPAAHLDGLIAKVLS